MHHEHPSSKIVNGASITTLTNHHRKNSQSRTLQRNLDSDLRTDPRSNNITEDDYEPNNNSMMNKGPLDKSDFLQNNYGSFKWVHGPNATVANSDLKGIGQLAAELA